MAEIDKIKINNVTYDIVPNTTTGQINANSLGLSYVNMMSEEEEVIDLYSIGGHGDISLSPEYKSLICMKDLLWENQNPTSSFAAQTVSIENLTDYSEVIIDYILEAVNYKNMMSSCLPIGTSGYLNASLSVNYARLVSVTTTGVQFGKGYYYTSYGSTSDYTVNQYLVPYRIWGWNPPHLVF